MFAIRFFLLLLLLPSCIGANDCQADGGRSIFPCRVFPQFLLFIVYPFWSAIFFSFSSAFLSLLIRALLFFFRQISGPESLCHVSLGSCCFCCLHFLVLGRSTSAERPESGKWTFCFFWCSWLSFFGFCFYDPLWRGFSWSWRSTGSTLSAGQRLGRFRCSRPADSS